MANVLITGGTGMIGQALTKELLRQGNSVFVLTRKPRAAEGGLRYFAWNPEKGQIDEQAVAQADAVVHLAGANVADGRWTEARKREIVESRVKSGELLAQALTKIPNRVEVVVSASAIGWYGPDPHVPNPRPFVESDPADDSFLGQTCVQWEKAIAPAEAAGKRLVWFRIGIVLSREGGAYAEFRKPQRFGIAPLLGGGNQVISWVHVNDLVRLFLTAIENKNLRGVYNAVAPQPVSNRDLILTMSKAQGRFYVPAPVPAFALRLALGEMSVEILKSATVSSARIHSEGFRFDYPSISEAVHNLEGKE